jgi:uncharacterized phage-associated protein
MVRVFRVGRPVATVRVQVDPYPVPAWEFGPVANTIYGKFISYMNCAFSLDTDSPT